VLRSRRILTTCLTCACREIFLLTYLLTYIFTPHTLTVCTGWIHTAVRRFARKPRQRRQIPARQRRRSDAFYTGNYVHLCTASLSSLFSVISDAANLKKTADVGLIRLLN